MIQETLERGRRVGEGGSLPLVMRVRGLKNTFSPRICTVAGYDLSDHQMVRFVRLTIDAAREPFGTATVPTVTVGADGEAALRACPVHVEQRPVADVAHLSYAVDGALPRHISCSRK